MDRVRNEEVHRRAGIERELASRADQRVLRWFGHVDRMDEYRMATTQCCPKQISLHMIQLPKSVDDGYEGVEVRMDGWCGLRQQRNDGGGCTTKRERSLRVESPGTYVTE